MCVLVMVVYCEAMKNRMTETVLRMPRQIRRDSLLGMREMEF